MSDTDSDDDRGRLKARASELGLDFADLARVAVERAAVDALSADRARKLRALPVKKQDHSLYVAMLDPTDGAAIEELRAASGCEVIPMLADPGEIEAALKKHYGAGPAPPVAAQAPPVQGVPYAPPPASQSNSLGGLVPYRNANALASYYLGLFSIFPALGLVMGAIAFYLGRKGLGYAKEHPEAKGVTHAQVGIGCGLFGILVNIAIIYFIVMTIMHDTPAPIP